MIEKCPICGNKKFIQLTPQKSYYLPEIIPKGCTTGMQENVLSETYACTECGYVVNQLDNKSMEKVKAFPEIIQ